MLIWNLGHKSQNVLIVSSRRIRDSPVSECPWACHKYFWVPKMDMHSRAISDPSILTVWSGMVPFIILCQKRASYNAAYTADPWTMWFWTRPVHLTCGLFFRQTQIKNTVFAESKTPVYRGLFSYTQVPQDWLQNSSKCGFWYTLGSCNQFLAILRDSCVCIMNSVTWNRFGEHKTYFPPFSELFCIQKLQSIMGFSPCWVEITLNPSLLHGSLQNPFI